MLRVSSNKVKAKKILNELRDISDKFFELYPAESLRKWDSDVGLFETFEHAIKDSLEDK